MPEVNDDYKKRCSVHLVGLAPVLNTSVSVLFLLLHCDRFKIRIAHRMLVVARVLRLILDVNIAAVFGALAAPPLSRAGTGTLAALAVARTGALLAVARAGPLAFAGARTLFAVTRPRARAAAAIAAVVTTGSTDVDVIASLPRSTEAAT